MPTFFSRRLSSFLAPLHERVFSDWFPRYSVALSLAKGGKCSSCCEDCDSSRVCVMFHFSYLFHCKMASFYSYRSITYFVFSELNNAEKKRKEKKRKCFCSDCNGKYRSWNTVKRHRALHGTGKLWLVVFSILDKKET